jgi:uncharacterized pyridoxamine 5'-phosphate oxidase family protein
MEKEKEFLAKSKVCFLATIDEDKPRCRAFGFMLAEGSKFYFCTSKEKAVYKQLVKNPYIELCSMASDMSTLRLSGKVVFDDDANMKKKIMEGNPIVKSIYESPDNPVFEIFYLDSPESSFFSLKG